MKFGSLNRHKQGQIRSNRALVKWIRCGILRSFICDGSQGLILSKNNDLFQKKFKCWDLLGVKNGEKSEMFDEMGQNSSKFGNFDTNRCAPGVGPQKCWFGQMFPNFLGVKIHSSFLLALFWLHGFLVSAPISPY